ncbi:hypothetical protein FOZ60_012133, partial [Perkinsus olseni]
VSWLADPDDEESSGPDTQDPGAGESQPEEMLASTSPARLRRNESFSMDEDSARGLESENRDEEPPAPHVDARATGGVYGVRLSKHYRDLTTGELREDHFQVSWLADPDDEESSGPDTQDPGAGESQPEEMLASTSPARLRRNESFSMDEDSARGLESENRDEEPPAPHVEARATGGVYGVRLSKVSWLADPDDEESSGPDTQDPGAGESQPEEMLASTSPARLRRNESFSMDEDSARGLESENRDEEPPAPHVDARATGGVYGVRLSKHYRDLTTGELREDHFQDEDSARGLESENRDEEPPAPHVDARATGGVYGVRLSKLYRDLTTARRHGGATGEPLSGIVVGGPG